MIVGIAHLLAGLLVVALSVPLALGRVGMNRLYGVRLSKAFESDAHWYAINAYGGRVMTVAGAVISLIGVAALVRPPSSTAAIVLLSIAPAPIVLLAVVPIVRFAGRLD